MSVAADLLWTGVGHYPSSSSRHPDARKNDQSSDKLGEVEGLVENEVGCQRRKDGNAVLVRPSCGRAPILDTPRYQRKKATTVERNDGKGDDEPTGRERARVRRIEERPARKNPEEMEPAAML
jgi:hypothetical protein